MNYYFKLYQKIDNRTITELDNRTNTEIFENEMDQIIDFKKYFVKLIYELIKISSSVISFVKIDN